MNKQLFDANSVKPTLHSVRLRRDAKGNSISSKKYIDPATGKEEKMNWFTLEFEPIRKEDLLFSTVRNIAVAITSFQPSLFSKIGQLVASKPADWDGKFDQLMEVRVYDVALPFSYTVKFKDGRSTIKSSLSIVAIADQDANALFERAYKNALKESVSGTDIEEFSIETESETEEDSMAQFRV